MRQTNGRVAASIDGEFVVFLIGTRLHRLRDLRAIAKVGAAMRRMLVELGEHPELGLLRAESGWFFGGPALVQYWRSYEQLEAYARSADSEHLPAWRAFNQAVRDSSSVGIWHETYKVGPGDFETIYEFMPTVGLAAASTTVPLDRRSTSAQRIGVRAGGDAPVDVPV